MPADPLILLARHGRFVLVAGLVAGLVLPTLAAVLRPLVPVMVALLLFLAALRIGPAIAEGAGRALPRTLSTVLSLQLALPLAVIGVASALGVAHTPTATAMVIMCAAPSIAGSPNICAMLGAPPQTAMRLLAVGTALLPLTVIPVFWFLPELGATRDIFAAAVRLLGLIVLAAGAGLALRRWVWRAPGALALARLDGVSALVLAVFVIGLMPALGELLRRDPGQAVYWLALACGVNFGLQIAARALLRHRDDAVPVALIAGNRNMALFLVALSPETTAPMLIYLACYQIPMYLTPLVMAPLYRGAVRNNG